MGHGHGGARPGAGRPKGVPNKQYREPRKTLQQLAAGKTKAVIDALEGIVKDATIPAPFRIRAGEVILDRGHGRVPDVLPVPAQPALPPPDDEPIGHEIIDLEEIAGMYRPLK
jgi:hypothetical protein